MVPVMFMHRMVDSTRKLRTSRDIASNAPTFPMTFKLFTELLIHHMDTVVSEIDGAEPDVPHLLDCFDSTAAKTDFFKYFTNVSAACRMLAISEASHASCV